MAVVQAIASDNGLSGDPTITLPQTSTPGNAMLVFVGVNGTIGSVSDSASNTYAQDATGTDGSGTHVYAYRCKNIGTGATTVTVHTVSGACCVFVVEESGLNASAAIDVTATNHQPSTANWTTGNPATTSSANDTLYAFAWGGASANINFAAGSGWSTFSGTGITTGHHGNTADGDDSFCERQTVTSTGVYPGTGTNTTTFILSIMVAYKQATVPVPLIGQATPQSGGSGGSPNVNFAYTSSSSARRCYAGGVVTQLNMYVGAVGTAVNLYLGLYDINGNLLCTGSTAVVAGLNTVTISNGPTLVYGNSYWLVFQVDGTITPADDGVAFSRNAIANATLPLPSTLSFPGTNINAGNESLYAAGTLGAVAQGTPLGGPSRVQWHWR